MFDAADGKKLILQIALLLVLDQKKKPLLSEQDHVIHLVLPENDTLISNICQFLTIGDIKMGISSLARKFLKVFKTFFCFSKSINSN